MSGLNPQVNRAKTWQPWGFDAATRESVEVYGDSRAFFVCPDHVQATDLGNTGENPAFPLLTVTRALSLARAYHGDTIYVMSSNSWKYSMSTQSGITESVIVPANKPGVRIIGVGHGSLPAYWQPGATGEFCVTVRALDTVIENFAFWGDGIAANGIYAEWDGLLLFGENLVVNNCVFTDGIDIGIQLEYAWYNTIKNCMFDTCDAYGIYTAVAGSGTDYSRIYNNTFSNCAVAMALLGGSRHNHIHGNSIYNANAQSGGAATDEGINTTGGGSNQVFDNYLSCILPAAAPGDYDDLNTASATDAWINNHCMNGDAVANPT